MAEERKSIPVVCGNALAYAHKKVLFSILIDGKDRALAGTFHVELNPARISIRIHPGRSGELGSIEYLHLSQEAVDSIRASDDGEFDFVVTRPLGKPLFQTQVQR